LQNALAEKAAKNFAVPFQKGATFAMQRSTMQCNATHRRNRKIYIATTANILASSFATSTGRGVGCGRNCSQAYPSWALLPKTVHDVKNQKGVRWCGVVQFAVGASQLRKINCSLQNALAERAA